MPTVAELVLGEESGALHENARLEGWQLSVSFVLGLAARDESRFWLLCRCDDYPSLPPAWHWFNPDTRAIDRPGDTPKGGNFFHTSGVICAPWNRLAYKSTDPRGPHEDWAIGDWRNNPYTRGCKTLSAMALRIAVELKAPAFGGRMG